jgi:hypothetical protein
MMGRAVVTKLAFCIGASAPRLLRKGLGAACVALAACTSQPLVGRYAPPSSGCCASLADSSFSTLPLGKEVEFSLSPNTPTLLIDGRREHFAAFSVPSGSVATAAALRSYLSSGFLPKATAVAPEVHFFDAQFRPLGKAALGAMQSDNGFWRASVSGRVDVPSKTRYIAVIATDGKAGLGLVRSDNGTPYRIPPAALGDMSIRLFGEVTAQ